MQPGSLRRGVKASTCLSGFLGLAAQGSNRQDPRATSPLELSPRLQGRTRRDQPAVGRLPHPQARFGRRAALVRQRVPILYWQLSVVGFLRGRPTNLDMPPLPDDPKSRLFTPVVVSGPAASRGPVPFSSLPRACHTCAFPLPARVPPSRSPA